MEQQRINQILEEKQASDTLREAGVLIDLGDHRPASEILRALTEMGVLVAKQVCRYWRFRGRRIAVIMVQ